MPTKNNLHPMVQSFTNEPLMIDPNRAELVSSTLQYLATDPEGLELLNAKSGPVSDDDFWAADEHPYRPYNVTNGVLQIPVQGTLINRFSYQFGRWATGYKYIESALARGLADPQVTAIAMIVDSPGGDVAGCFELVDKIYEGRTQKPIRAFAADHAYSAAYALASAASEIVVSRSGGTGSVGVTTGHMDVSGAMDRMGVKMTLIYAGKHKVDGNSFEKLPDSVKGRIQDRIDRIYGVFTSTVARNRGIDESIVRDSNALTYDAQDSIAQGFADKIGALDEEMVIFTQEVAETEDEQMSITQEQMDAAVAAARSEGVAEGQKAGSTAGAEAERTRVSTILGSDEAKNRPAAAQMMIDLGVDADKASVQLAKLPEEVKAEAAPAPKPEGKKSGFEAAMENGNPDVGAEGGPGGKEEMSVVDSIFASVGHAPVRAN